MYLSWVVWSALFKNKINQVLKAEANKVVLSGDLIYNIRIMKNSSHFVFILMTLCLVYLQCKFNAF